MKEFICMMAYLTAMVALSIDAMLPALHVMGVDLEVARANSMQFVVSFIFIGMTLGQVIYGPLSDTIGRKPTLFIGLGLFITGSAISFVATSLPVMLLGRFIQGLGVAGPRIVTLAVVRDKYAGRDMAYVMSLVMGVFIMVPAVAPSIGQAIIHVSGWRAIFMFYIVAALLATIWSALRLEETLTREHHRSFNVRAILSGFKEAATTRVTLGYTICGGLAFGAMMGYINSAQQVFQDIYDTGSMFAVYFGILAISIGAAFFCNSALVRKLGMRLITRRAIHVLIGSSASLLCYSLITQPPLLVFMLCMSTNFFCMGLIFGNLASMALEPMGHMAGLASSFNGAVSTLLALLFGIFIGQELGTTVVPLAAGFLGLSLVNLFFMHWAEQKRPA